MRIRLLALTALPLALLTGCDPAAPEAQPSPSYTPTQEQLDAEQSTFEIPSGSVLGFQATATASNGAVLELTMIVHGSVAAVDGADAVATTTSWCAGEVDAQLLTDSGYTFTTIDVTATASSGEWPVGTPLWLQPQPWANVTLAATGDLVQVPTGAQGDVTPHCATPVQLDGPGSGTIVLGIQGDIDGDQATPPLGGWMHNLYGANSAPSAGPASDVTFSHCIAKVSQFGSDQGAGMSSDWGTHFDDARYCNIGGSFGEG